LAEALETNLDGHEVVTPGSERDGPSTATWGDAVGGAGTRPDRVRGVRARRVRAHCARPLGAPPTRRASHRRVPGPLSARSGRPRHAARPPWGGAAPRCP